MSPQPVSEAVPCAASSSAKSKLSLEICRTLSQDVAALTGTAMKKASLALNMVDGDRNKAYRLLMGDLVPQDSHEGSSPEKRYRTIKPVGRGEFGVVYLAQDLQNMQNHVAIKSLRPDRDGTSLEVEMMQAIRHPFVVPLLDWFSRPDQDGHPLIHIVMDFLPQNLHQKIGGTPLPVAEFRCCTFQLLRVLAHLDGLQVCHRDLKPENILMDGRTLKVADFGSAKKVGDGPSSSYIGSRWWRAPELVLGSTKYTTSVDWWSCGCICAEMMSGRPLFQGPTNWGQMYEIIRIKGTPTTEEVCSLNPGGGGGRIVRSMLKLAETDRPALAWTELFPAYSKMREALDLPLQMLTYTPNSRRHPLESLCNIFFDAMPTDPSVLPVAIFDFTDEELNYSRPEVHKKLQSLSAQRQQVRPPTSAAAAAAAAADNGSVATTVSATPKTDGLSPDFFVAHQAAKPSISSSLCSTLGKRERTIDPSSEWEGEPLQKRPRMYDSNPGLSLPWLESLNLLVCHGLNLVVQGNSL